MIESRLYGAMQMLCIRKKKEKKKFYSQNISQIHKMRVFDVLHFMVVYVANLTTASNTVTSEYRAETKNELK